MIMCTKCNIINISNCKILKERKTERNVTLISIDEGWGGGGEDSPTSVIG